LPVAARAQNIFFSQNVGSTSTPLSITVTAPAGGTVNNVAVLTQGAAGMDFAAVAGSSSCPAGTSLAVNGSCTLQVTFTPTVPGVRAGAVLLLDGGGNVLGTAFLSGTGEGGLAVFTPGYFSAYAGRYSIYIGNVDDGGPATSALLYLPTAVAIDGAGNLFIADSQHHRVRMVCSSAPPPYVSNCTAVRNIVTVAGDGIAAYSGDGGPASKAALNTPSGVAVDGAGNIYIADTGNNVIRVLSSNSGVISTFAGNGSGNAGYGGDGAAPTSAQVLFNQPTGVSVDPYGNVCIADTGNHRIRCVNLSNSLITTVAGSGPSDAKGDGGYSGDNGAAISAELNSPHAVAFDANGNMYIPDTSNNRIRKVLAVNGSITPASTITTFAGTGTPGNASCSATPVQATASELSAPSGVAVDAAGNVYISDTQDFSIREVNSASGLMLNLAVNSCLNPFLNGTGLSPKGDTDTPASVYGPVGIALDGKGNLFFADSLDMVVAEIQGNYQEINYTSTPVRQGSQSTAVTQNLDNDGNAALNLSSLTAGTNTALGTGASNACVPGSPYLAPAGECSLAVLFAPQTAGNPLIGTVSIVDDVQPGPPEIVAANSPLTILLTGDATAVNSTTTVVTSSPNPSDFGQPGTLTVTVSTGSGTGNLTGTVSIADTYNGTATTLANALPIVLNAAGTTGQATYNMSSLGVGTHTIVASYNGDSGHFSSTSTDHGVAPYTQVVQETTTTTLTSSANPATLGASITFTAQVSIGGAGGGVTPDGSVTFSWGSNAQSVAIDATGKATYTTSALPNGLTVVTAAYGGDSTKEILASQATLNEQVQVSDTIGVSSGLNPSIYGDLVTFTAAISTTAIQAPTGTVNFMDNGAVIGTGQLSGNPAIATYSTKGLAVGTHPITVSYAGDNYNTSATSASPLTETVNQTQTSTTVSAVPAPGIAGSPIAITATVQVVAGSATVTGKVTFSSGSTTLGSANLSAGQATINVTLAPGSYPIVASYPGDANDQSSTSAAYTLTVNQATTQTTVSASPNPGVVAQSVTFSATVTGSGATPTGTVTFMNGATTLGSGTLSGGKASYSTSSLAAGTYPITAVYSGDTNDAASTAAPINLTVSTIATTTTLGSSTSGGQNAQVILVASVVNGSSGPVPSGTVTFSNGTTTLGATSLDAAGIATLVPNLVAGSNYTIVATYGGDASHAGSTSQSITITGSTNNFSISLAPPSVSLPTTQNVTVTVNFASYNSYTDTLNLGCAALPAGMNCHFSPTSVALPANGTVSSQLTIDTNNPLGGGASAMNRVTHSAGTALAGLLLPGGIFLGLVFWRRRRLASLWTTALVLALSMGAFFATGCGNGISTTSVAPGTYTIEVTATGVNNDVIHYQTIAVTVTQ
jgi:hypothetical protein